MKEENKLLDRSRRLLGSEGMQKLAGKRVILFGVGGVGSWCAECLIRSGITHLTMVDNDNVCATNCNRQLMATTKTIGEVKVEAMKRRLLDINPEADIQALCATYSAETADTFQLETYDYIIDAIDSLRDKADLILRATELAHETRKIKVFSSMGAALRIDPTQVRVAEFWKVNGDALARALRNVYKKNKTFPAAKFTCVYSEETPLPNLGETDETCSYKAQINGSMCPVTGIFGMTLAGMVIKDSVNG